MGMNDLRKTRGRRALAAVVAVGLLLPAPGQGAEDTDVVSAYRQLFNELENSGPTKRVSDRGRWPRSDLLASYLEVELITHARYEPTLTELRRFLERWPEHPLLQRVLRRMDQEMTEKGGDAETLAWYRKREPTFAAGKTRYLQLLLWDARTEEVARLWPEVYRIGGVIPDQLAEAMKRYPGLLTIEDHEARALALWENGKASAFTALIARLPSHRKLYMEALVAARGGQQKRFADLLRQLPPKEAASPVLWYERIEELRESGHWESARALLQGREGKYLNDADRQRLRFRLGRDLFYQEGDLRGAFQLMDANAQEMGGKLEDSLWLAGFSAFLQGNKDGAIERFTRLAQEGVGPEMRSQGGYWAARLLEAKGEDGSLWYQRAADAPDTFYGFLGAEKRRKPLPPPEPAHDCQGLREDSRVREGLARMETLRAVGRIKYNKQEINALGARLQLTTHDQLCLARNNVVVDELVRMAKTLRGEGRFAWDDLYPVPPWTPDDGWVMDPAYIWGVVRQESMFQPEAESHAGAVGLMQFMPATARNEAKLIGKRAATDGLLRTPAYSLSLGQSHLQRLLRQFDGDMVLALVGYNAGPKRSQRWRDQRRSEDPLTFIERVPIHETRGYIKKVIGNMAAYQVRIHGVGSVAAMLPYGKPGAESVLYRVPRGERMALRASEVEEESSSSKAGEP